jgi:hypothetical protein
MRVDLHPRSDTLARRSPAVAGSFYPAVPSVLAEMVDGHLSIAARAPPAIWRRRPLGCWSTPLMPLRCRGKSHGGWSPSARPTRSSIRHEPAPAGDRHRAWRWGWERPGDVGRRQVAAEVLGEPFVVDRSALAGLDRGQLPYLVRRRLDRPLACARPRWRGRRAESGWSSSLPGPGRTASPRGQLVRPATASGSATASRPLRRSGLDGPGRVEADLIGRAPAGWRAGMCDRARVVGLRSMGATRGVTLATATSAVPAATGRRSGTWRSRSRPDRLPGGGRRGRGVRGRHSTSVPPSVGAAPRRGHRSGTLSVANRDDPRNRDSNSHG